MLFSGNLCSRWNLFRPMYIFQIFEFRYILIINVYTDWFSNFVNNFTCFFIRYKYLVYLHVEELFCYPISLHFYLNHSFWVRYNGREIWSRAITLDVKQLLNSFGALWDTITHFITAVLSRGVLPSSPISLWKVMHLIPNLCTNSLQI